MQSSSKSLQYVVTCSKTIQAEYKSLKLNKFTYNTQKFSSSETLVDYIYLTVGNSAYKSFSHSSIYNSHSI